MKFTFTRISKNKKTGEIPTSITDSSSCPVACPFAPKDGKPNGCYAAYGPLNWHWKKLDNGKVGISANELFDAIKDLPSGTLMRHNVAGDLCHKNEKIDMDFLNGIINAARNRKVFTYTHHVVLGNDAKAKHNRNAVKEANEAGFTINLSGNNCDNADELKALKIAPVVTIVPSNSPDSFMTKAGNKVIVCPAQTRENVNCAKCKLCQNQKRSVIIGFKAHGVGTKKVEAIAAV